MRRGGWAVAGRVASCAALLVVAVVVEGAWAWRLGWTGGAPEPVLVAVLVAGLRLGPEAGALVGFAAGLLQDLAGGGALGLQAASKLLLGFAAGSLSRTVVLDSLWAPVVFAAAGTLLARSAELALLWMTDSSVPLYTWASGAAVAACYNAVITPLVFAGLRTVERWRGRLRGAAPLEPRA